MKPEQAIEKYLCRRVKEHNGLCVKLVGTAGIPDRLVILPDGKNSVFVELKTDGGRVSPIQNAVHNRLKNMNQTVYILWNFEDVDEFIKEVFSYEETRLFSSNK